MIRWIFVLAIVIILLSPSKTTAAEPVPLPSPSRTWDRPGSEWAKWPSAARMYYLMGVLDAWVNVAASIGMTHDVGKKGQIASHFSSLVDCQKTRFLTYDKVYSLVEAEAIHHKDQLEYAAASMIWEAVAKACGISRP